MVNPPHAGSPSAPGRDGNKSARQPLDNDLAENSQENLDARLDHAIEETFPTSDPVSVTVTKGPAPEREARPAAGDRQSGQPQASTEHILNQVRDALHEVSDQASGVARDVYDRGEQYARQARERYPEAERYFRQGQRAVTQQVTGNPLLALFMAAAAGYALAWLIHGERRNREPDVPDYGRTGRGYAPHRDKLKP
ncbi:hypothetical protein ILT44_01935 [Microvirga sp. BT689]|uniref:hypothetical protein n=1 Tax=Microvirga arvi TaxID=2778731 RepID=UPI00194F959D|nr:hypothetical protein [Microvirga arvi]MBM6578927.1 hypothetical protein [Microvirga arvi]